jgi:hypothetical protein
MGLRGPQVFLYQPIHRADPNLRWWVSLKYKFIERRIPRSSAFASATANGQAYAIPFGCSAKREKRMTVCIAAGCEGGKRIVTATDGTLSAGSVTADTLLGKMFWLGDWQFMYAGTPANVALISGIIEEMSIDDPEVMSRRKILTQYPELTENSLPTLVRLKP